MKCLPNLIAPTILSLFMVACGSESETTSSPSAELSESDASTYLNWVVNPDKVTSWLNCRSQPSIRGDVLQRLEPRAYLDNNFVQSRDELDRLWLEVIPYAGDTSTASSCWVIAEADYLLPVTRTETLSYLGGDRTCQDYIPSSSIFSYAETANHFIYLCSHRGALYYHAFDRRNPREDGKPSLTLIRSMTEAIDVNSITFFNGDYSYEVLGIYDGPALLNVTVRYKGRVIQQDDTLVYIETEPLISF